MLTYLGGVCDAHLNMQIFTERYLDLKDQEGLDQTQEVFVFLWHLDLGLTIESVNVAFDRLIEHFRWRATDLPVFQRVLSCS